MDTNKFNKALGRIETKLQLKDRLSRRDRVLPFNAFLVVRRIDNDVEIHAVGFTKDLDVSIDDIHMVLVDDLLCDTGLLNANVRHNETNIVRLGSHPDRATGLRITWCSDVEAVRALLEDEFNVLVAS